MSRLKTLCLVVACLGVAAGATMHASDHNTGSRTISRLVGTGSNVFIDALIAAPIPTGSPADVDADSGVLSVIDHGAGQSHLSTFSYTTFGELAATGTAINVVVAVANGWAVVPPCAHQPS